MLGQFTRKQAVSGALSTTVQDAIKEYWTEEAWTRDVTLDKREKIWQEWWMGASSTHKECPRMFALMAAAGPNGVKKEVFKPETLWLFGVGNAYHRMFQHEILTSFPKEQLLGRWKKPSDSGPTQYAEFDNEVPEGTLLERGWGIKPDGKGWMYDEPKMRIPEYRRVVKVDAILNHPDRGLEVAEIKTEKSDAKDALDPKMGGSPRFHHIEQVHVGMWATGINQGRIIYVFKNERFLTTSIVEHEIERDELLIDDLKSRAKDCIGAVKTVEDIRDSMLVDMCSEYTDDAQSHLEGLKPLIDVVPEFDCVRAEMKKVAEEMPKLQGCQWKSKGKPLYCPGRDLCFGVRKKKVKK